MRCLSVSTGTLSLVHLCQPYTVAQVKSRLQTFDGPIRLLCATEQAGQPVEIHLPGQHADNSAECLAYEHQQHIWTSASTPTAAYMHHLVDSMNGNSPAGDLAERGMAAQAAPDLIHQLYEWIGGTSCSLQGTQSTYGTKNYSACISRQTSGAPCVAHLPACWAFQPGH